MEKDSTEKLQDHGSSIPTHSSDDNGLVARILRACASLLDSALSSCAASLTQAQRKSITRVRQLLCIWGDDHGVLDGTLDTRLQKSKHLLNIVVSILREFLNTSYEGLVLRYDLEIPYHGTIVQLLEQTSFVSADESDSESGSNGETDASSEPQKRPPPRPTDQVLCNLQKGVRRLNDLNASLLAPVLDFELERAEAPPPKVSDPAPHQYLANCIRERFPEAPGILVDQLGKTSLQRYQRLQRLRFENVEAIAINVSDIVSKPDLSVFQDSGYGSGPAPSSYQQSQAPSTHHALSIAPSVAPSHLSSLAEAGRSKYPKLPDEARAGALFECAACGRYILATRKQEYRKHLIEDLIPYVCMFDHCASGLGFADRQSWVGHLKLEHGDAEFWKCPKCPLCKATKETHALITDMAKHLEEIALLALPTEVDESDSELESRSDDEKQSDPAKYISHIRGDECVTTEEADGSLAVDPTDAKPPQPLQQTKEKSDHTAETRSASDGPKSGPEVTPDDIQIPLMPAPTAPMVKTMLKRPERLRLLCPHCDDHQVGFPGQHELERHIQQTHDTIRRVWVCEDKSGKNPEFLAGCKFCQKGKRYHAYYNAASHLRRSHFDRRERGRKPKGEDAIRSKADGHLPHMDELKQNWIREIIEMRQPDGSWAVASTEILDWDDKQPAENDDLLPFPPLARPPRPSSPSPPNPSYVAAAGPNSMPAPGLPPLVTGGRSNSVLFEDLGFDPIYEPAPWAIDSSNQCSASMGPFPNDPLAPCPDPDLLDLLGLPEADPLQYIPPNHLALGSIPGPKPSMVQSTSSIHPPGYSQYDRLPPDISPLFWPNEADPFFGIPAANISLEGTSRIKRRSAEEPHGSGKASEAVPSKSENPTGEGASRPKSAIDPTRKGKFG